MSSEVVAPVTTARPASPASSQASDRQDIASPTSETSSTTRSRSGSIGSKQCSMCGTPRNVLIRCQIDDTSKWHFICPGSCWKSTGGADGQSFYRYGGTWKNRHELVSAKIKGQAKEDNVMGERQAKPFATKARRGGSKSGRDLRDMMGFEGLEDSDE
jgi:hypothetical protein